MSEHIYEMTDNEAKLCRYENLEKIGHMIILPVAVGQMVWAVSKDGTIHRLTVDYFYCSRKPNRFFASNEYMRMNFRESSIGKSVFTSYDDAVACVIERGAHED